MSDEEARPRFAWLREVWGRLSSEQQLGVSVFGVCGFLTLVFSTWYLYAQIQAPFLAPRKNLEASRQLVSELGKVQETQDGLRLKDTDGDGLNDWDELNTYRTSPYLADSDSDGLQDGIEVSRGTDPNCPQGRDCQPRLDGITQRSSTSSGQALLPGTGATTASPTVTPPPAQMSAADIRSLLIRNRVASEADLQTLSDQQVLELYRRGTQGGAAGTNAVPSR
jgi:hypothetical protein